MAAKIEWNFTQRNSSPIRPRRSTRIILTTLITFACGILFFSYAPSKLNQRNPSYEFKTIEHPAETKSSGACGELPPPPSLATTNSKYAFATLLAADFDARESDDWEEDRYFVATRVLAYQFLHAPDTRTTHGYPFVVMVAAEVSESKRERLRKDGAIVVEVEPFEVADWFQVPNAQWRSVLTKMRVFELTQFEWVVLLDGDTQLTRPLDDIFNDPAVVLQTTANNQSSINSDEAPLPPTYGFAGTSQLDEHHNFPPTGPEGDVVEDGNYMNAGFVVVQPSLALLKYYVSLMTSPVKHFEPYLPEQHLWNYAHRVASKGGNMPWAHLNLTWNVQAAKLADVVGGAASIHEKFWGPGKTELLPFLQTNLHRMQGFWEGVEAGAKTACELK